MNPHDQKARLGASLFTIFVILLFCGLYLVLRPFLTAGAWAVVIALTTWPLYRRLMYLLGKARWVAPWVMSILAAGLVIGILLPLGVGVAREGQKAARLVQEYMTPQHLSQIVASLPLVKPSVKMRMQSYLEEWNASQIISEHPGTVVDVATIAARGAVRTIFNLIVLLVLIFLLYSRGERITRELLVILREIGGTRFQRMMDEARQITRAAVYGMVMTAIAQGTLAGLGYYVAGAPVPLFLGVLTTILSLLPFGAPLVYLPVALIVTVQQSALSGILLAAWGLGVVSMIDNVLRPYFISQASTLPFLLVFVGVIGGLLAFGLVGIIIGPVVIALSRVLWHELLIMGHAPTPAAPHGAER